MKDLILALDCSLRWTNVAVFADGGVLLSKCLDIGRRQAAELPRVVEGALKETGRAFSDIGLVAVTNGPGYFTGIRVGAAYAAALAYGLGVKIAPVSTLHMLAYPRVLQSQPVLALVYAGRESVYAASFGCAQYLNAEDLPAGEYKGGQLDAWLSSHESHSYRSHKNHEGLDRKSLLLVSDNPEKIVETSGLTSQEILQASPDASTVAEIAWNAQKSNDPNASPIVFPMELKISYHRDPQVG